MFRKCSSVTNNAHSEENDSAVPFGVRLFFAVGRAGLWMGLWMGGLAFGRTGETFVFHLTSICGFCKYVIISILSKSLLLLGTSESTQIQLCFL